MRFLVAGLSFLALAVSAAAQHVDTKRVDEIWSIAQDRMVRQNDIWFDAGDYPRIIQCLRIQHGVYPADYEVATNLGWMLENIEEWDQALAVYIEFRNQNPHDPDAPYPEAYFYFTKHAYDKIPPLLEPTLTSKPHPHPNTFRTLAHAYEHMNMFADAQRVWKTYLAIAPNDPAAKLNLQKVERKLKGG